MREAETIEIKPMKPTNKANGRYLRAYQLHFKNKPVSLRQQTNKEDKSVTVNSNRCVKLEL